MLSCMAFTSYGESEKEVSSYKQISAETEMELMEGFQTAAIRALHRLNLAYRLEFLSNNPSTGRKVLASMEQELASCDQFKISVAFITKSGVTPLLQVLK